MCAALAQLQCDRTHIHRPLEGGLARKAQVYTQKFLQTILSGLRWDDDSAKENVVDFNGVAHTVDLEGGESEEEEGENLGSPRTP